MIARGATLLRKSHACGISVSTSDAWNRLAACQADRTVRRLVRGEPEIVSNILSNTEISVDHMTPEVKLFLLTPNCPLYHAPFVSEETRDASNVAGSVSSDSFWSIYWPGGQALTRFILDERARIFPPAVRDEINVLDLGAGCGASAIAAKLVGAKTVLANDIDKAACVAISMNAILNNADIEVSRENLLCQLPEKPHDVIFVGDMLYDEEIAEILLSWLQHASERGSRIYIGDPGRHCLTNDLQKRLRLIRQYSLPESVRRENHGFDKANIWEFHTP